MKKLFYIGLAGLSLFEIGNVFFIMPMPGSQEINSIDLAYFLYSWRWIFRVLFTIMVVVGFDAAFRTKRKWLPVTALLLTSTIIGLFNFQMSADKMFLQSQNVVMKTKDENQIPSDRLVIGVENNGEAKAYPIAALAYHHQVRDNIGGKQVMVTYCSVCRTGRVYEPVVNGNIETFRLVGMDHFNAMFEDEHTGSWWRQSNGESVAGELKGMRLKELSFKQLTVSKWFDLYPNGSVMQPDQTFLSEYDSLGKFEKGKSKSSLTGTDSSSWNPKSWVVGIELGNSSKAYDWNDLKNEKIINDVIGNTPIFLVLSTDGQSFAAFERPVNSLFTVSNDILYSDGQIYNFAGVGLPPSSGQLKQINAYQEFWHSWSTFHPGTQKYIPIARKIN